MTVFDPNACFGPEQAAATTHRVTTLTAVYDLAVSPATFDIVGFLVLAEHRRRSLGHEALHVVIAPGPDQGFRQDAVTPYGTIQKRWRRQHILSACCWLVPSVTGVTVCGTRYEAGRWLDCVSEGIFPERYTVERPIQQYRLNFLVEAPDVTGIRASQEALRHMHAWRDSVAGVREVVTLNLRECDYETARNSDLAAWGAFARQLDPGRFFPVVIRDSDAAYRPLPPAIAGLPRLTEVIWNLDLRTALYEIAFLNLFVNNGPAALARHNARARSLTFKMITPSAQATTEEFFRANGLRPGDQFKGLGPGHRFVWQTDTMDVLQGEFDAMCHRIDRDPAVAGRGPDPSSANFQSVEM